MSQSISFWKQEAQLLPRDHVICNINPNLNRNRKPNTNDFNSTKHNPIVNQLMHPQLK